jgi:hypothetical protein
MQNAEGRKQKAESNVFLLLPTAYCLLPPATASCTCLLRSSPSSLCVLNAGNQDVVQSHDGGSLWH